MSDVDDLAQQLEGQPVELPKPKVKAKKKAPPKPKGPPVLKTEGGAPEADGSNCVRVYLGDDYVGDLILKTVSMSDRSTNINVFLKTSGKSPKRVGTGTIPAKKEG